MDFVLFGGTHATNNTITLYSYYNYYRRSHSTVLFLNNSVQIGNVIKSADTRRSTPDRVYIPGLKTLMLQEKVYVIRVR